MPTLAIKEQARKLLDQLPENSTWDDLMYEIYVRMAIEKGLEDSKVSRVIEVSQVRQKVGLLLAKRMQNIETKFLNSQKMEVQQ